MATSGTKSRIISNCTNKLVPKYIHYIHIDFEIVLIYSPGKSESDVASIELSKVEASIWLAGCIVDTDLRDLALHIHVSRLKELHTSQMDLVVGLKLKYV